MKLKQKGNDAFQKKKYEVAEKFYSDALQLNLDSRPLWTNRAICRNTMKKHDDALADCMSALSIDSKCTKADFQIDANETHCSLKPIKAQHRFKSLFKTINQKGNALLGLGKFDEAKECYESLRELGENSAADKNLKKLHDIQEKDILHKSVSIVSFLEITIKYTVILYNLYLESRS